MDSKKSSNRTDLLAAGKKRLQQFRQKKDNRGRDGKGKDNMESKGKASDNTIGKADKLDHHEDEANVVADSVMATAEVPQFSQEEDGELRHDSGSSAPASVENSVHDSFGVIEVDHMSVPILYVDGKGKAAVTDNVKLPHENPEAVQVSFTNKPSSSIGNLEHVAPGMDASEFDGTLQLPVNSDGTAASESMGDVGTDAEGQHKEAQEADNLGSKQYDGNVVLDTRQTNSLPECRSHEGAEATVFSQGVLDALATNDSVRNSEVQVSPSATDLQDRDQEMAEDVASSQVIKLAVEKIVSDTPSELFQGSEDMVAGSFDDATCCLPVVSGDSQNYLKEQEQDISILEGNGKHLFDGSNAYVSNSPGSLLEMETENLAGQNSISSDAYEIPASLSQSVEVRKWRPREKYMFPINYQRDVHTVPSNFVADVPQTWQEQLYLANILKDFFLLQLLERSEQQMDVQEQNKSLDVKLAGCKSELQDAMRAKKELHNLLQSSNIEVNKSSAAVYELKIQLADCTNSLAASEAENERLLRTLSSLTEDKNKLEEVNEHFLGENKSLSLRLVEYQKSLASLQAELANLNASIDFSTSQERKLEEEKSYFVRENENLLENLAECKHILESLQEENTRLNLNLATEMDDRKKLLEDREFLVHESERLSSEKAYFVRENENLSENLAKCKHILQSLQEENTRLSLSLATEMDDRKKLLEDRESLVHESERLSSEIAGYQEKLSIEPIQRMQLEDDLKDATTQLEGLIEDNVFLHNSLVIHKTTLIDLDSRHRQLLCEAAEVGNRVSSKPSAAGGSDYHRNPVKQLDAPYRMFDEPVSEVFAERLHLSESNMDVHDNPGFIILERHMEEADIVIQELEKAVDKMHSYSASLSRSMDKDVLPAVSKLIEVFESKAHFDDHDLGGTRSAESQMPSDPYLSAKNQARKLKGVLKAIYHNAEYVSSLFSMEKDSRHVAIEDLEAEVRILKDYNNILELRNIELEVLYAAFKQHAYSSEVEKIMLETGQMAEKVKLNKKLTDCNWRISELQNNLCELRRTSSDFTSELFSQMEYLQKEIVQYVLAAEGAWSNTLARVVHIAEKLDAAVGKTLASPNYDNGDTSYVLDCISASVDAASQEIQGLKNRIEATSNERNAFSSLYEDMGKKYDVLHAENGRATVLLQRISGGLVSVLNDFPGHIGEVQSQKCQYSDHDPLDAGYYEALITHVSSLLGEIGQLKELNDNLHSELLNKINIIEELKKKSIDPHDVLALVQDVIVLTDAKTNLDESPLLHIQSSVSSLVQKYKEASEEASLLRGDMKCKMLELGLLQEQFDQLNSFNFQLQNEILIIKESLIQAKKASDAQNSELQKKVLELEQSEQRVASVREKLSIAVAKGKGLVVQRDSLKQSLAETSTELERCAQELRLKDSRISDVEEKFMAYSEAGERMEALESELSYIRNSATALRESFLLKDATLQRIEEILEDLELSEHFHSKGIIEKVDWLAKSVTANSVPPVDWDQRSSAGGGSHSDAGFMMMDAWKEEGQLNANPVEELRRKYDELQTKFYEFAEQNEMLEQSLMERNNLVQRWEEVLDRINTPPELQSMEPEKRIECLGSALSEADHHLNSLRQKIEHLENYSELLSADLEESQRRVSSLESNLQEVIHEKEEISGRLAVLTSDHGKALEHVDLLQHEADQFREVVDALQKKVVENLQYEDQIRDMEGEICRLQDFIIDALPDSELETVLSNGNKIECLQQLLKKFIENYRGSLESVGSKTTLAKDGADLDESHNEGRIRRNNEHMLQHTDSNPGKLKSIAAVVEEETIVEMRSELDRIRNEMVQLQVERDEFMEKYQSLTSEMEALAKEKVDLQELVGQGEQKSASLREKLNVAVRKGKSLVQQRDSLKQSFEDMTSEIGRLKSELNLRENTILELEKKISEISFMLEQHKALEAESVLLKNQLTEVKQVVQERELMLSMLLNKIDLFSFEGLLDVSDPVLKLDGIKRMCSDLHATVASSQQETMKSKRAAELLLAELNEVQERNDGLQEELRLTYDQMSNLSKEKDAAASTELELLSLVDKLSEERRKQLAQFEELKSSFHEVGKGFFEINALTADIFEKDVELLNNLRTSTGSNQKQIGSESPFIGVSGRTIYEHSRKKGFLSAASFWESTTKDISGDVPGMDTLHDLHQLISEIGNLKERISRHSILLQQEAELLINDVSNLQREVVLQKESLESMMHEFARLESTGKGKDMEIAVMRRSISLLYDACVGSVMVIESGKSEILGNISAVGGTGHSLKSLALADGGTSFTSETPSEESVKDLASRILFAVKDFVRIQTDSVGGGYKELRTTISNLQKELQEKDAQNERIHAELVSQIKEAEAAAARCAQDFEFAKNQVHDSVSRFKLMEEERSLLEQKLVDLQQKHIILIDLQEKVKSLTDVLATKEQEVESLMQALDEEEVQMEGLRSKIQELEEVVQKKNLDLQHVESSRAKAMKKLSVTVAKFDELHHMSEGLLSEIENLEVQLQERDSEISFLRQEVTRSTNDALLASKMTKETSSNELHEFLTWLNCMCSRVLIRDVQIGYNNGEGNEFKEHLQKDIVSLVSELEDLRVVAQSKDALLYAERDRVEELMLRKEALEVSLRQKESELSVRGAGDFGAAASEIVEVEPVIKKWAVPLTSTASQVRSLRKANNDHVSVSIDADAGGTTGRLQDEEDDKIHGFKSLTTSRFVPKFTRPVSDTVDGLWVSCDRALMRQPAFRLGIIIYWTLLHGLLASFVV
ncbi:hypothetical protein Dimus_011019 [Dionaea muscipula]